MEKATRRIGVSVTFERSGIVGTAFEIPAGADAEAAARDWAHNRAGWPVRELRLDGVRIAL